MFWTNLLVVAATLAAPPALSPVVPLDGNRFAYLDGDDIYYPQTHFPRLTTPQWVGDEGVEAVVILAIDDMRDTAKYEGYLRPILQRLKQIDGRAPVSIMTCAVKPDDPQLQTWLQEGVSLEVHTFDHPCPLLQGSLAQAKGTYDKCVDLLASIPNNRPVAYRMPCCDSLNTVSPRFFHEIFNHATSQGNFLQLSSSVFQVFTAADPAIPPELLFDADGKERFRKYFPKGLKRGEVTHDRFLNHIENYPYPYVIGNQCWEFPCMTPSDWEANFLHQPNNPQTMEDLKAALDITVLKQGVLNLVFHPHGWIQAEQVNSLIDHAVATHGKKVKFLTFKEAIERLNHNLQAGHPLRNTNAKDNGVRILDVNADGFMDCVIANGANRRTRVWQPESGTWLESEFPIPLVGGDWASAARFGVFSDDGHAAICEVGASSLSLFRWADHDWRTLDGATQNVVRDLPLPGVPMECRDLNADGITEILCAVWPFQRTVQLSFEDETWNQGQPWSIVQWNPATSRFEVRAQKTPSALRKPLAGHRQARLVDLNEDGYLDWVFSNPDAYGVFLWNPQENQWSIELLSGNRGEKPAETELPPMVRADGSDNGFFVRERGLHWMNEDTAHLPNLVISRDFDELLGDRMPAGKTPHAAIESMRPRPGYAVELMAHEPLTMDPVAFQWGPDGKLWVVEMADYPNGLDGKGQPGGRIRFLEDANEDGRYDRSTVFLDGVSFPSGVHPWKNGVLVSAAPEVFFAADTDGDGVADTREVLYTGFAEDNQQHRVNGFVWGLDGWLYLGNGDSGGIITSTKTGEKLEIRGRDLRIHPETGRMEAVNGQTQFGRARDDFDHWFGNNNSRPLWQYVLDDHFLARNPHLAPPDSRRDVSENPGPSPVYPASRTLTRFNDFDRANRFTSACSAIVYRDRLLGSRDVADLPASSSFVSEPVHNLVHREVLAFDGIRYTSRRAADEQQSEFLASTDNWFRPTQLRTGPDGALWVADMYRLVIEHPQWIPVEWQERLNVRDGDDKGRLWRIYPHSTPPRSIPRLDLLSVTGLAAAMDSPSGWQRDMVQQLLLERLTGEAAKESFASVVRQLVALVHEANLPEVRVQALYTLDLLDSSASGTGSQPLRSVLLAALQDRHPSVRAIAIRLAERHATSDPRLAEQLCDLVSDSAPAVQFQLAATLGALPGERPADALCSLLVGTADLDVRAMGLSSITRENLPRLVFSVLMIPETARNGHPLLEPLLTCAVALDESPVLAQFAALLLVQAPAETKPWQWSAIDLWLQTQQRQKLAWNDWLQASSAGEPRLSIDWAMWQSKLRPLIDDGKVPAERRAEALRIYARLTKEPEWSAEWLRPTQPPELRAAALQVASRLPAAQSAELLIEVWPKLSAPLRATARNALLGRSSVALPFLNAVAAGELSVADIDPETEQLLRSSRDVAVRQLAEQVLLRPDSANRMQLVADYLRTMPEHGDSQAGRELFSRRCAQCHKLGDIGHSVGPDLASLTDKSIGALVTAVLDPNRAVEAKFLQFGALTQSGQTHSGLIQAETATSVTLLAAEAKATTLLRDDLDDLWAVNKSLMPEGLEKELSPTDLANVVAFVRGNVPLPARKQFPGNEPRRVAANSSGEYLLTPATCEIYGPTIVLEAAHNNLGWWSSADDLVSWSLDVPEGGRYRVILSYACDDHAAGHRVVVTSRGSTVSGIVNTTGGWDQYRNWTVGEIELLPGVQTLTLKPASRPLPALLDLQQVKLQPVK